jgi:glucokinase
MPSGEMAASEQPLAVGVDLGATKIEAALVGASGRIIDRIRAPTLRDRGPDMVLEAVADLVTRQYLSGTGPLVAAVGVGVAGQVDTENGIVRDAPNLNWKDFPIGTRLERALARPVAVLNDVQAITYGEHQHGAGRGTDDLVCVFVGTGVGGGIIVGGKLIRGCSGNAGEFGHMALERDGPPCSCGSRGCLEAFVGGWAIARQARQKALEEPAAAASLLRLADGEPDQLSAELVGRAAAAGDPLARILVADAGSALGVGLASIANALNPSLLVLGGGVVEGLPNLVELAEQEFRRRALRAAREPLRILRSQLGSDAGVIGAAHFAREMALARKNPQPA